MVVVALLSLIVLALMAVFDSTQKAFRASITQTDLLEGGRAAMDLMANDVRLMSGARDGTGVNFYANTNANYQPMIQPLTADSHCLTNVLEKFFILQRENLTWTGVGYAVRVTPTNLFSLYRFSMSTNVSASAPLALYNQFTNDVYFGAWDRTNGMSLLMDGVVSLTARAYDVSGAWLTTTNVFIQNGVTNFIPKYTQFFPPGWGEVGLCMTNDALPAAVEIQMNVFEDQELRRAEGRPDPFAYLSNRVGQVHVFRQRIVVPNVDRSVYQ